MAFSKAVFANMVSWTLTLLIGVIGKNVYEKYLKHDSTAVDMSFFQMLIAIIVLLAVVNFVVWGVVWLTNKPDKKILVLKDIADNNLNKDCAMYSYGKFLQSGVPVSDFWQEWIRTLIKQTERDDLNSYNFGDEYCFFELSTGREVYIPVGNKIKTERISGSIFRKGSVLRLIPINIYQ